MAKEKAIPSPTYLKKISGMPKLREPHKSEIEYFKKNKHVAGMATSDKKVILNPHSKISEEGKKSVYKNEVARLHMKESKNKPKFDLTPEQKKSLKDYGSKQDKKETVAARISASDSSSGIPSKAQVKYVESLNKEIKNKKS